MGELQDRLHVIVDRLNEAGAALRKFVLRRGALRLAKRLGVMPVAFGRRAACAVLVVQTNVEPDRRVERGVLVQAQPGEFLVKNFPVFFVEVTILDSPVRDGPGDAMD